MKALNGFGFPVLRFNFRGAGLSHGEHDQGDGEVEDVKTALDWLHAEFHLPLIFSGFSFGAAVGLRAAVSDVRVKALIGVGVPVGPVAADSEVPRTYTFDFLRDCAKPKLFVSGARDQFGPRAKLEALVASLPEPKKLVVIEGADHFFEGRLRELRETIESWVREEIVLAMSLQSLPCLMPIANCCLGKCGKQRAKSFATPWPRLRFPRHLRGMCIVSAGCCASAKIFTTCRHIRVCW